jgi:phosphate transport system substrate-binding protein
LAACSEEAPKVDAAPASSPPPQAEERRLTVAGSSTIQPVMEVVAQTWEKSHPHDQIDVQGGGSGVGVSSARSGLADIGMVSRDLSAEEADLVSTSIGLDGIAMIVHASNPLTAITKDQVVKLYADEHATWKAVGGGDKPVTLVTKEEGRSTLELFEKHFDLKGKIARSAVVIGPNGQAIQTVAGDPQALAYVSIGSAAVAESQGTPIHRLALDGVEATVENVRNHSYPLSRTLNLATKGAPTGFAKELVDFVLSDEGQAIVEAQDFVRMPREFAVTDAASAPADAPSANSAAATAPGAGLGRQN